MSSLYLATSAVHQSKLMALLGAVVVAAYSYCYLPPVEAFLCVFVGGWVGGGFREGWHRLLPRICACLMTRLGPRRGGFDSRRRVICVNRELLWARCRTNPTRRIGRR